MLAQTENDLICRVGPATPMGILMREYWVPALLSSERLPNAADWFGRFRLVTNADDPRAYHHRGGGVLLPKGVGGAG